MFPTIIIGGINLLPTLIDFGVLVCIYLMVSLSINLEFGYAGVPNFGKVLFVAAGGLLAGSMSYYLMGYVLGLPDLGNLDLQFGYLPKMNLALSSNPAMGVGLFFLMLGVGASVAALFGFLASYPAINLREDYLGMLLLAAGEFFRIFVQSYYPITGSTEGLGLPNVLSSTLAIPELTEVIVLAILGVFTVGMFLYVERVARSPLGRSLRAMRDNEMASSALGKNNVAMRRNVLIIGSALAGIAGVLFTVYQPYISPTTFLRTQFTFTPFVIVILGGAANNYGVLVGTLTVVGINDFIDNFRTYAGIHNIPVPIDLNAFEPIAIGILLIVVLMFRPKGILPEKPTLTLKKSELKKIMESAKSEAKEEELETPAVTPVATEPGG
jgi:branched-chain amino acid transport system permease protein